MWLDFTQSDTETLSPACPPASVSRDPERARPWSPLVLLNSLSLLAILAQSHSCTCPPSTRTVDLEMGEDPELSRWVP